jgi:hypothetical protein
MALTSATNWSMQIRPQIGAFSPRMIAVPMLESLRG